MPFSKCCSPTRASMCQQHADPPCQWDGAVMRRRLLRNAFEAWRDQAANAHQRAAAAELSPRDTFVRKSKHAGTRLAAALLLAAAGLLYMAVFMAYKQLSQCAQLPSACGERGV